jgi:hypothetical protein
MDVGDDERRRGRARLAEDSRGEQRDEAKTYA